MIIIAFGCMICFAQNETNGSVDFNDKNMAITSC